MTANGNKLFRVYFRDVVGRLLLLRDPTLLLSLVSLVRRFVYLGDPPFFFLLFSVFQLSIIPFSRSPPKDGGRFEKGEVCSDKSSVMEP